MIVLDLKNNMQNLIKEAKQVIASHYTVDICLCAYVDNCLHDSITDFGNMLWQILKTITAVAFKNNESARF